MNGFFTELRRRKVYRVAATYGVVAWFLIQLGATVVPAWELPPWCLRALIVVVLAGFPAALLFGWAYDITARGLETTPSAPPDAKRLARSRPGMLLLCLIGLVASGAAGWLILPHVAARSLDKSIAVLPFENFSANQDNAFFADGIQDDVLTNLARVSDLRVISRTSVMPYRGQQHNIREIGKALNVGAILEGSVRREANRVRVNVQLIDASNDRHLWAQVYDREMTDVFAIQSELAQEIAAELKAKLSPDEQQRIEQKPTENGEAYLLYLQAHEIFNRPDRKHDDVARAEELYEKAIALDPTFALAYARLSQLESWSYYAIEASPARMQKARAAAEKARQLQPDLAETHLAVGLVAYYVNRDYEGALRELAMAREDLPNDAVVLRIIAAIQRRQGRWEDSLATYQKAAAVDPKDPILLENMAWNYLALRRYPEAAKAFDRAVEASPDTFTIQNMRARVDFEERGDLERMRTLLANTPETTDPNGTITLARYNLGLYERDFPRLLATLQRSPAQTSRGETSAPIPRSFLEGNVYALMKDETNARTRYEKAREIVEAKVRENPDDAPRHALLGLIYAGLGRCDEAKAEGKRAVDLLPESKDAFDGPIMQVSRARISLRCGDAETALAILAHSLDTPSGISVHELRMDPTWDALRADPRYQKMLSDHGVQK